MEVKELEAHIRTLATVEETASPLISCYIDLSSEGIGYRAELDIRLQLLRKSLGLQSVAEFDEAASRIVSCLEGAIPPRTQGMALFARGGESPFWRALQFEVPLPNWIAV